MLQCGKFESLKDSQHVHFSELMESVPNSFCEVAENSINSKSSASNSQSYSQINKSRNKPQKTIRKQYFKSTPSLNKNCPMHSEAFYDKSSRSLFPSPLSSQFNNPFHETDSKLEHCNSISNQPTEHHKLQNNYLLREIIKKYKIQSIVANFVTKLKRTSVSSSPIQFNHEQNTYKGYFCRETGFELPQFVENILSLLTTVQTIILCIVVSMCFVFESLRSNQYTKYINIVSFCVGLCELGINLLVMKSTSGKKLKIFIDIWKSYAHGNLFIDSMTLFILLLNCLVQNQEIMYLEAIIFFKIPQILDNIERLEVTWIKNFYNQQYWSLAKIIISNFCFAHIISILLVATTKLCPEENWMTQKGIWQSSWQEQYIWSYYWANTIMLTIGFGDIVASNYKEAVCLIFIQTFSCLLFAYNINCIGGLIQHIRSQDAQRSKKSKIFKKLTDQNHLNEDISWKINNYIEENAQLRKKFNFQQEKEFIGSLPVELKKQYLKQSNKKIFENIQFFKSFISKTLYNLAQKIEMRVSHPDEVIQKIEDDYNLLILKAGQIGFFCKKPTFNLKDFVMNIKKMKKKEHPCLLNLDFIVKKRPHYQIRSIQYSIFFYLDYDTFIEALKDSAMDYEYYCSLRDKMKSVPDEFELFKCETCNGKHLKAICPRLHFIPYIETVIHKYLHKEKTSRNEKMIYTKRNKRKYSTFKLYKRTNHAQRHNTFIQPKRRLRDYTGFPESAEQESANILKMAKNEANINNQMKRIQETYLNITFEVIKEEINKLKKSDFEQDQVWILKMDQLCDYNSYFPKANPNNIFRRSQGHIFGNEKFVSTTAVIEQMRSAFENCYKNGQMQNIDFTKIKSL